MPMYCCAIGCQHSTLTRLFGCVFLVWRHYLRKVNKSSCALSNGFFLQFSYIWMFLNIQIDLIILKTYDQQFTLPTKKSLHIIFKSQDAEKKSNLWGFVKKRSLSWKILKFCCKRIHCNQCRKAALGVLQHPGPHFWGPAIGGSGKFLSVVTGLQGAHIWHSTRVRTSLNAALIATPIDVLCSNFVKYADEKSVKSCVT